MALADGSRARVAAEWLATQIDGFDDAGIESHRWRETEWCLYEREDEELMRQLLPAWPSMFHCTLRTTGRSGCLWHLSPLVLCMT